MFNNKGGLRAFNVYANGFIHYHRTSNDLIHGMSHMFTSRKV